MRFVLGALGILLVALLAIFLITSRPSSNKTKTKPPLSQTLKLPDYSTRNSVVSETTQGRVLGEDQYRAIRVTVNANNRTIDILRGYEGNVLKSESLTNTQAAYDTFLRALDNYGFSKTKTTTFPDERGVCALSNRFIYDLQDSGKQVIHSWSASCSAVGSFAGNGPTVRQLFQNQIPDYNDFVSDVRL